MYRAVLDPGVLIAALISAKGAPRALLEAWMKGTFELIISPNLVAELRRVLEREKFRQYFNVREARSYVAFIQRFAAMHADMHSPPRLSTDPGDDYLIALARSAAADYLVSGDPDLCLLKNTTPPVLTPRAFLNRIS